MKKYIISGIVIVLVGLAALPFAQRVVSVRELESKVRAVTDEKSLTEVPKSLMYRVEGTDWFLSGFSCPYGQHKYSLNPYFGFLGEFDLRIDTE